MLKKFKPTNDTQVKVRVYPYDLQPEGRMRWTYTMLVNGKKIFDAHDFSSPRFWTEEQALYCILGFLTLRPGDTDKETFATYTPEQLAWAQSSACEALQCEVYDYAM